MKQLEDNSLWRRIKDLSSKMLRVGEVGVDQMVQESSQLKRAGQ